MAKEHKVEILRDKFKVVSMREMFEGDVAVIVENALKGEFVMRNAGGWFGLSSPTRFWAAAYVPDFLVRVLDPGTELKLTVGGI